MPAPQHPAPPHSLIDKKNARRYDDCLKYTMVAGKKALAQAGLEKGSDAFGKLDLTRCGVLVGSGMGGLSVFQDGEGGRQGRGGQGGRRTRASGRGGEEDGGEVGWQVSWEVAASWAASRCSTTVRGGGCLGGGAGWHARVSLALNCTRLPETHTCLPCCPLHDAKESHVL
jgi:hypothetical protein